MSKVRVHNRIEVAGSYRVNRTKSLFNVEDDRAAEFDLEAELPIEDDGWNIGLIVGPSGSGKTSLGRKLVSELAARWWHPKWTRDRALVDDIKGDYDTVTGALASVGLGDVPAWLRPYSVLSNGEQFRASLARLICEGGERNLPWVVDEFSSVVDRQVAQVGSGAFAKAARRANLQAVLLSCHHDIVEWLEPDWCYDTGVGQLFLRRGDGATGMPDPSEFPIVETLRFGEARNVYDAV